MIGSIITARQQSCGKVMSSVMHVCLSVHQEGGMFDKQLVSHMGPLGTYSNLFTWGLPLPTWGPLHKCSNSFTLGSGRLAFEIKGLLAS